MTVTTNLYNPFTFFKTTDPEEKLSSVISLINAASQVYTGLRSKLKSLSSKLGKTISGIDTAEKSKHTEGNRLSKVTVQKSEDGAIDTPAVQYIKKGFHDSYSEEIECELKEDANSITQSLSPFHKAAMEGDETRIHLYIKLKMDINEKDSNGYTLLHYAAIYGHEKVVELLIKNKADLTLTDDDGNTPLHKAAFWRHLGVVKTLINEGADESVENFNGLTPLSVLLLRGQPTEDNGHLTARQLAVRQSHLAVTKYLMQRVEDIRTPLSDGSTLLHFAAGSGDIDAISYLINANADLTAKDETGFTPLHDAVDGGHKNAIELLLKYGADVNAQDTEKRTPLHIAVMCGNKKAISILKDAGANLNTTNKEGSTPLHFAVGLGEYGIMQELIDAGADVDAKTNSGSTPLHIAVTLSDKIATDMLIRGNADLTEKNKEGLTPLQYAIRKGHAKIAQTLKDAETGTKGTNIPLLHKAALQGDLSKVKTLVGLGMNVDIQDKKGWTPLHYAAANRQFEIMRFLIHQAKAELDIEDQTGFTPLHYSVIQGHPDVTYFLIRRGADLEVKDGMGWTLLRHAVASGNLTGAEILVSLGADATEVDREGRTLLHHAVLLNQPGVVHYLLKTKKINANEQDIYGKTALDLAFIYKNPKAAQLLNPTLTPQEIESRILSAKKMIDISQSVILDKMKKYLLLKERKTDLFQDEGHCNGFTFLMNYYWAMGIEDDFYRSLEAMAKWDEKIESLDKQAFPNQTLEELIEQWLNDVIWFQQNNVIKTDLRQHERKKQLKVVSTSDMKAGIAWEYLRRFKMSVKDLESILSSYLDQPYHVLEVAAIRHIVSVRVNADRTMTFYDSNLSYKCKPFENMDELAKKIFLSLSCGKNELIELNELVFKRNPSN